MTIRRAVPVLCLLVALAASARAQDPAVPADGAPRGTGSLLGTVVAGDSGEPLQGTGIELLWALDTVLVAQTLSNGEGTFRLGSLPEGLFFIRLSTLGYGTVATETFELAYGEVRDLGTLPLPVEALELEPIRVSTERVAVTFEADRTSYNVGVMAGTEGAAVSEALRNIPELEVDIDGRVTLRGSTPVIYIDGRPAPMTGEALVLFLEQFRADFVARVEVMENPSARYAAEGSAGIVNIVLKEGAELGMSGSVSANMGTRGQHGLGARVGVQKGKWTVTGNTSFRLTDLERAGFDLRQNLLTDPAFLQQDSWSDRSGLSGSGDVRLRYEPTERLQLDVRGRVNRSGNDSDGVTTTTHMGDDQVPILRYDRASASESRGLSGNVSASLQYEWEPRRHELEIEVSASQGRDRDDSREEITSEDLAVESPLIPSELTLDEEADGSTRRSVAVDYTRPWGEEGRFELGYDLEVDRRDHDRTIRFVDDPVGAPDGTATDRGYGHDETVNAAYLSAAQQLGSFGIQVGVRAEHTAMSLDIPTGEVFDNDYVDIFPSANISYRIERALQFRLSYSRRVQRPGASVLNPTDRSTDPLTRRVGNPDVEPAFTHSVSLNASWSGALGNLRLSPYYRLTYNDWAETITVDDQGISTRTYQNLASQESYGASLTYSFRPGDGWNGMVSFSGRRTIRDASNLSERYSGSSLRWSGRANINARLYAGVSLQGNFSYSPPVDLPQGRSDAQYRADFGVRYRFLGDRASLRLAFQDPFQLRRSGQRTQDLSYIQIGRSREDTRDVSISVSYSFGGRGTMRGGYGGRRR